MGKTVMITGAGSGFGKGAALALAARGHAVIATTETDAQCQALAAEAPQLTVAKLDITTDDVDHAASGHPWSADRSAAEAAARPEAVAQPDAADARAGKPETHGNSR